MIRETLNNSARPRIVLIGCLKYAFGLIHKKALEKTLYKHEISGARKLLSNGYFLKNCKLYVYKILKTKKANYRNYKLEYDDARCLRSCISALQDVDTSWPYFTLEKIDEIISILATKKLDIYMGKFITKKLSFLVQSYGLTYQDIKSDMIYSGINAIYKSYPHFESDLHAIYTAKRAIHNAGMGLISYNTKECRSQLYRDQDGLFQHKMRDISTVGDLPFFDNNEKVELHESLLAISNRSNIKGQKFIRIASGQYDKDFSEYLGCADNSTYVDQCKYSTYIRKLREFLDVTPSQANKFFTKIRGSL